jgi:hypothetical protein
LLFGCQADRKDLFSFQGKAYFHTTPPSRIYFKNIRSYHYQSRTFPESRADVFQLQKMVQKADPKELIPSIIDHWLEEEAYLLLLPHPPLLEDRPWDIRWESEQGRGKVALKGLSPEEHRSAVLAILEGWDQGRKYFLNREGKEIPLWQEEEMKNYFRQVYADFLRLTESD